MKIQTEQRDRNTFKNARVTWAIFILKTDTAPDVFTNRILIVYWIFSHRRLFYTIRKTYNCRFYRCCCCCVEWFYGTCAVSNVCCFCLFYWLLLFTFLYFSCYYIAEKRISILTVRTIFFSYNSVYSIFEFTYSTNK